MIDLGLLLFSQHLYEDAKPLFQRAIEIKKVVYGESHVLVAVSHHNYGVLLHKLGELEKAKDSYSLALKIRAEKLGEDHVDTVFTRENLEQLERELCEAITPVQSKTQDDKLVLREISSSDSNAHNE
jgi:tetratricopeptide (TPR) repeat protein